MRRNFKYRGIKFFVNGKWYNDGDYPHGYYSALYFSKNKNAWCRIQQIKETTIYNTRERIKEHVDNLWTAINPDLL